MKYRTIGNSDLKVSVLGLGGNIFGHFTNLEETKKIISLALNNGINFIDTANVYSKGLSEKYIGECVKGKREKFIIATKAGLKTGEIPKNKFTYKYIIQSIDESLTRLKTDYIDLYQVHNYDLTVPLEETMDALNEIIEQGKVRYIGCSNYNLEQLKKAFSLKHKHKFISLQNKYNMFERDIEKGILELCKKQNIGILVYSGLARGLLTGKYKKNMKTSKSRDFDSAQKSLIFDIPEHFRAFKSSSIRAQLTDKFFDVSEKLEEFALKKGVKVNDLALSWILSKPEISSIIIGVRNSRQLLSNIKSVDVELNEEDIKEVDFILNNFSIT